jgi:hypothetical protein
VAASRQLKRALELGKFTLATDKFGKPPLCREFKVCA